MTNHTPQTLAAFTERTRQAFLDKRIAAPVHLCSETQAEPLIEIFKDIGPDDWLFSGWRSSYHALLKGIPEEWVFSEILAGRSMYLTNREHRFMCSSIVGGILPIALGVAMAIKRRLGPEKVWVCVGDMSARTGLFHEFLSYADGHRLPISVILEDNGLSTNAPTEAVWGSSVTHWSSNVPIRHYRYTRTHPHVGVGSHVAF